MAGGINNHFLTISYGNCRPRAYNVLASSRAVNCESRILFSIFFLSLFFFLSSFCERIRNTWKRANELIHCSIRKKRKKVVSRLSISILARPVKKKTNIPSPSFLRSNFKTCAKFYTQRVLFSVLDILSVSSSRSIHRNWKSWQKNENWINFEFSCCNDT